MINTQQPDQKTQIIQHAGAQYIREPSVIFKLKKTVAFQMWWLMVMVDSSLLMVHS